MTTRHADKSWAMATATWIDSIGDWFNSSDWSTGFVPGPGDDALIHLASNAGAFHISIIDGIATDVDFSNTGFISIEQGVLALGGVLNNSATFNIGGGFATVSATNLTNTGTLTLATEAIPGSGNARLSISGNASNTGTLNVDGTRGPSGSTLSVGGVFNNSGTLTLGNSVSANDLVTTVSAAGFVNSEIGRAS